MTTADPTNAAGSEAVWRWLVAGAVVSALVGFVILGTASDFDQTQKAFGGYWLITVTPAFCLAAFLSRRGQRWRAALIVSIFLSVVIGALVALLQRKPNSRG